MRQRGTDFSACSNMLCNGNLLISCSPRVAPDQHLTRHIPRLARLHRKVALLRARRHDFDVDVARRTTRDTNYVVVRAIALALALTTARMRSMEATTRTVKTAPPPVVAVVGLVAQLDFESREIRNRTRSRAGP